MGRALLLIEIGGCVLKSRKGIILGMSFLRNIDDRGLLLNLQTEFDHYLKDGKLASRDYE